ncbi:hypothetical protein GCM10010300_10750 [Streptomyces olivaceoviridis]|uniref:SbcC/MukB-like Walker B domain-containing protein n=1 Tax=Streptomyces olivaceoviridis TaxID=1921 RepID=UPI001989B6F4|nr:SbcC/MukB-like Walker B domain-containing protein [Streptomyces olivaceoviridis]GGY69413.1 hypothetical protein GCM10010300_10750 [Streptomyces olivaceoviridis]
MSATGPASGEERVLAASVPLFAAASSHYASAGGAHAPRLVILDEALAGVDDDSRAERLGLLRAFDLDVVMTSEREWACYPPVPGIPIAQLARVDDIEAGERPGDAPCGIARRPEAFGLRRNPRRSPTGAPCQRHPGKPQGTPLAHGRPPFKLWNGQGQGRDLALAHIGHAGWNRPLFRCSAMKGP